MTALCNLRFIYVPTLRWPLRFGWSFGSALQYVIWQWQAARTAARLDEHENFDVLHHVSYGTLLGGSFLWRLRKPLVFGPTGGGQTSPDAFALYFGEAWRTEAWRNLVVRRLAPLFYWSRACARRSLVLAGNAETEQLAHRLGATQVQRMLDVGLPEYFFPSEMPKRNPTSTIRVLWVGRLMPRKAVKLALAAIAELPRTLSAELTILGDGPQAEHLDQWADQFGVCDRVTWRGQMSWADVGREYARADIFLFTSLRDSCGSQLLEAMAFGLPVVTLDHQGAADLVPSAAGMKVPVTTPTETVKALGIALRTLCEMADERAIMGQAAFEFAKTLSWPAKARHMDRIYSSVIGSPKAHVSAEVKPSYVAQGEQQSERELDWFVPERYACLKARANSLCCIRQ